MSKIAKLLARNEEGQGSKPWVSARAHPAFKLALKHRAAQLSLQGDKRVSAGAHLIRAALDGDPELRRLFRQYAKTGDKAQ